VAKSKRDQRGQTLSGKTCPQLPQRRMRPLLHRGPQAPGASGESPRRQARHTRGSRRTSHPATTPPAAASDVDDQFMKRVLARVPDAQVITAAALPGWTGREVDLPQASVALWRMESTRARLDGRITVTVAMVAPRRPGTCVMHLEPTDPVIVLPTS